MGWVGVQEQAEAMPLKYPEGPPPRQHYPRQPMDAQELTGWFGKKAKDLERMISRKDKG